MSDTARILGNVILILFMCVGVSDAVRAELLTPEERRWLDAHPDIELGVAQDWLPEVVARSSGYEGLAFDHIALLNRKLGTNIRLRVGPWNDMVEQATRRDLAGLTMSAALASRADDFAFTRPFRTVHYFIYLRERDPVPGNGLAGLGGKRVGHLKRTQRIGELIAAHRDVIAVPTDSSELLAQGLLTGELDAVVDTYSLEYLRMSNALVGFAPAQILREDQTPLVISIRKDWPQLVGILDKGLAAITADEMMEIHQRWFGRDYLQRIAGQVELTAEERAWIRAHPVLRAGIDSGWAPVEFADENGVAQGVSAAYLKRLEGLLGIRFEIIAHLSWAETLAHLMDGRLDVLPAIALMEERSRSLNLTDAYHAYPAAIFSAAEVAYIGSLDALEGKAVAVVQGEVAHGWLERDWPGLRLLAANNTRDALSMVADGRAYAFVGNQVTTSYYIGQSGLSQIRVAGETPYVYRLAMGARADWPILASILQKGLDAIPRSERDAIYNDWISIRYEHRADYRLVLSVLFVAAAVLLVIAYWNRRLTQEVERRRRVEADLIGAKEEAETATHAKSVFLANISHELRTPLNAVLAFSALLRRDGAGSREKGYLDAIGVACKGLAQLIEDILDLSRLEARRMELHPRPMDMRMVLDDMVILFRQSAQDKGLQLDIQIDESVPVMIMADEIRLRQILVNLIANAIRFTSKGGVRVRAEVHDSGQDQLLTLSVTDSGPGIPSDRQDLVFDLFSRRQDVASNPYGGSGLGLSICRRLATLMGGTIRLFSAPKAGSTFILEVPLAKLAHVSMASVGVPDHANTATSGLHDQAQDPIRAAPQLLIVDDSVLGREALSILLAEHGYSVHTAERGEDALSIALQRPLDLILLDIRMPGRMDGLEVCRRLKADAATRGVPVIFLTGRDDERSVIGAFDAGAADYVTKPFHPPALLARVRTHIELGLLSRGLEYALAERTAELRQANDKLRTLAIEVSLIEEREKKRLAGDLHDSPMQKLALAQMQIGAAAGARDAESDALYESGLSLLRDALQELRLLQFELSPPLLYQQGLASALHWLAGHAGQRWGVPVRFETTGQLAPISPELAIILFQFARELVVNVVKHASASHASIGLTNADGQIHLRVQDDGVGMRAAGPVPEANGAYSGYGLFSIRERLNLLGGTLQVEAGASGTCVEVRVPLDREFRMRMQSA